MWVPTDTSDPVTGTGAFVMPHFGDRPQSRRWLSEALVGLCAQTDPDWVLIVVDDATPSASVRSHLLDLARAHPGRIFVIQGAVNVGAGACRNIGVRWASRRHAPIVLFHDADDVSHPRRLEETRRTFSARSDVDFVYAPIEVIDEDGMPVPFERLIPSLREIVESHEVAPVEGADAWIRLGTETGYTNVTSTVAVRTQLAVEYPFPEVAFSEDTHTWLRMSAGGRGFACLRDIPTRYRVPQDVRGQCSRHRVGDDAHRLKAEVDARGFAEAIMLAYERGRIEEREGLSVWVRFLERLSATMRAEGQASLADALLLEARKATGESRPLRHLLAHGTGAGHVGAAR